MGNQKSIATQQWNNNYKIIQTQSTDDNYMVLEDLTTGHYYVNKILVSNDQEDSEQLHQIINEKLNDPSPFLNKLLRSRFQVQQNYCSTKRNFHLLFNMADRSLKQQMLVRKSRNIPFNQREINLTVDNVSKGLLYLKKINQEHQNVSNFSISWPVNQQQTIQLIDSWSLSQTLQKQHKRQRFRSQEATQYENDLYCLGLTVLDMIPQDQQKYSLSMQKRINKLHDENLKRKLQTLLHQDPRERNKIYQIIEKQSSKLVLSTKDSERRKIQHVQSPQLQHQSSNSYYSKSSMILPSNNLYKTTHSQQVNFNAKNVTSPGNLSKVGINFQANQATAPATIPTRNVNHNHQMPLNIEKTNSIISTPVPNIDKRTSLMSSQNYQGNRSTQNMKVSFGQTHKHFNTQTVDHQNVNRTINYPPSTYVPQYPNSGPTQMNSNNFAVKDSNLYTSPDFFKQIGKTQNNEINTNIVETKSIQINSNNSFSNPSIRLRQASDSPPLQKKQIQELQTNQLKTPTKEKDPMHQRSKISTIHERSQISQSGGSEEQEKEVVVQYYDTGSRYQGQKNNKMRNGQGKFYYQEGSYYDGEWKDNKMHGFGRLFYANGTLAYEGEWYMDEFHGIGKVYNDNCTKNQEMFDYRDFNNLDEQWKYYEGSLVSDSKQGFGKIVLGNDEYYEGNFSGDRLNGQGKFYRKDGEVVHGIWKDSILEKVL